MADDDLDRELANHLELVAQEHRDRGATEETARRAARSTLGPTTIIREDVRALSPLAAWSDAVQDLGYGLRLLRAHPGFALAAALTLALGVGATTTIFSVIEAVLMRPLPYPQAERLAMVWEDVRLPTYTNPRNTPAPGNFSDWRAQNASFTDLAAIRNVAWTLNGGGDPVRIEGVAVSASLFGVLGAPPVLGRAFTVDDDRPGPPRVALLSHELWVSRFGGDAKIVGRSIRLNEQPVLVVGVMPTGFHFPDPDTEIWTPLGLSSATLANHDGHFLRVVGRLKPGITLAQAQSDLDGIAARLATQYPNSNQLVGVNVVPLTEQVVGDVRRPLLLIAVVTGFLLLMVCTNIGTLLLARASARRREFAVRAALGANRTRLVRQLLAEGVLLAAVAGTAGLGMAWSGIVALRALAPPDLPRLDEVGLNTTVAVFNAGLALTAGVICSLAPAFRSRERIEEALRDERPASATPAALRLRNLLAATQVALSVVVLVGAGLLLQSFVHLTQVPVGFQGDGVLTFRVPLPARYQTLPEKTAFYEQLSDRLHALPGASSTAGISFLPLTMSGRVTGISIDSDAADGPVRMTDFRSVAPEYFKSMSIPVRDGRDVSWSDTPTTVPVVIVSETAARTFWPGQSAIGRRLKRGRPESPEPWLTVVGVVGDVRQLELLAKPRPAMYFPATQDPGTGDTIRDWVIRATVDPSALIPAVRRAVWSVDPTLPITHVQTMSAWKSAATARQRFTLLLVSLFAALALLLAAIGLYGVTAYNVAQRTKELGVRIALGARPRALRGRVLLHGALLTTAGLATGLLLVLSVTHLMGTLLFEVGPRDPATLVGTGLVLLAVSLAASFVPAYRATSVDPVTALRV